MELIDRYKYEILGGVLGLFLVMLLISLGFWKTILVFVIVLLGAYLGSLFKGTGILEEWLNKHHR